MSLQEGAGVGCAGWRDLTQTKWRLSKGDEQLDFTYRSAPVPHHISDEAMSELAVCIYKVHQSHIASEHAARIFQTILAFACMLMLQTATNVSTAIHSSCLRVVAPSAPSTA